MKTLTERINDAAVALLERGGKDNIIQLDEGWIGYTDDEQRPHVVAVVQADWDDERPPKRAEFEKYILKLVIQYDEDGVLEENTSVLPDCMYFNVIKGDRALVKHAINIHLG